MATDAKIGQEIRSLMEYRNEAWKCVRCGVCRMTHPEKIQSPRYADNCPAGTRFKYESYYGSGRQELVRSLTTDPQELEIDDRMVHVVYTCTICGACQAVCNPLKNLEPANAGMALREHLVEEGYGPLPEHGPLIKSILNYDNPWMQPRSGRGRWAKKYKVKDLRKEPAPVCYFVGCTGSYDPRFREVVSSTAEILNASGADWGIYGEAEKCCGSTVFRVGARKEYEQFKEAILKQFNEQPGLETIVTACAGCFSTLLHEYEEELNPRVIHTVEFVAELVAEGKLPFKKKAGKKKLVTYHDPCHLGRYSEIFDAPRQILEALPGIELREMERIREWSWCCGAGGGVRTAFPDYATWVASKRLDEADETGAELLVTACPFCEQNLEDAVAKGDYPLTVVDLMVLVRDSLEKAPKKKAKTARQKPKK
jgi:heterodisulfide reductase subunit D